MSAANSGSLRASSPQSEDSFATSLLGRRLAEEFQLRLEEVLDECRTYGDKVPSYDEIARANSEAMKFWSSIPEPRVIPSINGRGQIILTVFFSNGTRTSIVV